MKSPIFICFDRMALGAGVVSQEGSENLAQLVNDFELEDEVLPLEHSNGDLSSTNGGTQIIRHKIERVIPIYVRPDPNHIKIRMMQVNYIRIGTNIVSDQLCEKYFPEMLIDLLTNVYEESSSPTESLYAEML